MNSAFPLSPSFGTLGPVHRQVRELLLNAGVLPDDANERPAAFCLSQLHIGVLPAELECRAWVYLEEGGAEDAVLVLAGVSAGVASYLAVNLHERATLSAMASALSERQIELLVASPGCLTRHLFYFSPSEADYLDRVLAEYLELDLEQDPDWMLAFEPVTPKLSALWHTCILPLPCASATCQSCCKAATATTCGQSGRRSIAVSGHSAFRSATSRAVSCAYDSQKTGTFNPGALGSGSRA